MSNEHQEWTARLSDYLARDLPDDEQAAVEAHLAACEACSRALEDLARIVTQAGALEDLEPTRDHWQAISAAIGGATRGAGAEDGSGVINFPRSSNLESVENRGPRRHALTRTTLAAAAIVLVALTASVSWWAGSMRAVQSISPAGAGNEVVMGVADLSAPPEGMAGELVALEQIVESARSVLDPNTVRVIERSLGVIEQAIADSREALSQDPGNAFLAEHLERMYRRKLVYLQDAVRLVEFGG